MHLGDDEILEFSKLESFEILSESKLKSEDLFHILGKRWSMPVIKTLHKQKTMGFNQIKNYFQKITPTTLSSTLKYLEEYGIVHKEIHNTILPSVSYSLTDYGQSILYLSMIIEDIPNNKITPQKSENHHKVKQSNKVLELIKKISIDYTNLKTEITKYVIPMASLCGTSSGLCAMFVYSSHPTGLV